MDDILQSEFVKHMRRYHPGSTVDRLASELEKLRERRARDKKVPPAARLIRALSEMANAGKLKPRRRS